jgi:hypothetical protein
VSKEKTYCSSVFDEVLHITLAVHLLRRVGTIDGKLGVVCDHKGETLTVRDVPVESVDLDPAHRVQGPGQIRDGKAAQTMLSGWLYEGRTLIERTSSWRCQERSHGRATSHVS